MNPDELTMLRRALLAGLTFRLRMSEAGGQSVLHLHVKRARIELEWATSVSDSAPIEDAFAYLFRIAAAEILSEGEGAFGEPRIDARPLPLRMG